MARVLFFTQTPECGAAARYRVYQYLNYLKQEGLDCVVSPAVTQGVLEKYNKSKDIFSKSFFYAHQALRRLAEIKKTKDFDIVFLQRDIIIHCYPFLEKLIARVHKNIIFDFDDAIYLYPAQKKRGFFFRFLWDRRKIERIIKLSRHVIVGNNFLKKYTETFTSQVTLIPTSMDLDLYRAKPRRNEKDTGITLGWIGSQGTFGYLEKIFPALAKLSQEFDLRLLVIGARGPQVEGLEIIYKDWSLDTEIEDIYNFDIGLMPLTDDEWSRGKSATKLLQYMVAGIPAVASPVGVNQEIIKDGVNGFLADSPEEWRQKISSLVKDVALSERISCAARKTVAENYSVQVNAPKLAKVIKEVLNHNF